MARKKNKNPSIVDTSRVHLGLPQVGNLLADLFPAPAIEVLRQPFRSWQNLIAAFIRLLQWQRLDFHMQYQQQRNWCWAAVATSVAQFYDPASAWTQCALANGELGRDDCCGPGASGPCNVYGYLDSSLDRVGRLDHWSPGTATFAQSQAETDGGRPLGVRTAWSGGGSHFLCIIGYQIIDNMLAVDDPFFGRSDVDYATFAGSYQGSGKWTDTYYTRA